MWLFRRVSLSELRPRIPGWPLSTLWQDNDAVPNKIPTSARFRVGVSILVSGLAVPYAQFK